MALFEIDLAIDETYKKIIKQYLFILCSFIFMIMLEPATKISAISLLFYSVLGMLFNELVLKQIIIFK